jgi:hypothetical protein
MDEQKRFGKRGIAPRRKRFIASQPAVETALSASRAISKHYAKDQLTSLTVRYYFWE